MRPVEVQQQLSDFVGEHGPYQLLLTVILFVRYVLLGLMANSGSLMAPDVTFYCDLPMEEIVAIMPNITLLNQTEQRLEIREEFKQICQLDLHLYQEAYLNNATQTMRRDSSSAAAPLAGQLQLKKQARQFNMTTRIRECNEFTYDIAPDQGRTMTSEFDLVCERDWLRSLFQSLISAAIVVAHVFWGTFSDNYGRYKAQKICLAVSLLAGCLSVLPVVDFWTFTVARALCSFGDLGLVVSLTTTVVELVGSQYRGLSVALVNFGYALGVTLLPYIVAYLEDFRLLVGFTVFCHLLTIPFILATNESVRWLLTNRKFKLARRELKRICRFNRSAQCCCSIWPLNELIRRTRPAGPHDRRAATRTISSQQQSKRAFDCLFQKFIQQIESQNLCDPEQEEDLGEFTTAVNNGQRRHHRRTTRCESSNTTCGSTDEPSSCSIELDAAAVVRGPRAQISISPDRGHQAPATGGAISETLKCDDSEKLLSLQDRCSVVRDALELSKTLERPISVAIDRDPQFPTRGGNLTSSTRSNSCGQLAAAAAAGQPPPNGDADTKVHLMSSQRHVVRQKSSSTSFLAAFRAVPPVDDRFRRASDGEVVVKRRAVYHQSDCINIVAHQLSFMGRVSRLFRDKILMIAVFTIVWTTFNSELQYTSFIIINLEVGEDVYLNYMLGGCMEALAAITASLLLSYASRRHSLICFWLLISASCFGLAVAHIDSTWAVWLLAVAKFSQSCLSSIASVAAYEAFPTFLRQSGSGLVFTLGGLGSVFAPLIFAEFDDHAGMDRVLMTFSFFSLTAATLIYMFLKETRNCELQ